MRGYLLPIFEKEGKKNRKTNLSSMFGLKDEEAPNSIYGELKLSDRLSRQIVDYKTTINSLYE